MSRAQVLLVAALLLCAAMPRAAGAQTCPGDCDADGVISDGDVRQVVESIFDPEPDTICPLLVGEGLFAKAADLASTVVRAGSECVPNEPPIILPRDAYRSYPGFEIALPIEAQDADGPLEYSSDDLPEGAVLEADSGNFRWTPAPEQVGPFLIPFRVTDSGPVRKTSEGVLALRITPLDSCAIPSCDPATGCTSTLPPLNQPCCAPGPVERVAEVVADCPGGKVLMIGRNTTAGTFGRMQNCDRLRLLRVTQAGVTVRIHLATRCFSTGQILSVRSRIETDGKLHTDRIDTPVLQPTAIGFAQKINLILPLRDTTMMLEGKEANLSLTLTDPGTGVSATETLRVVLQHGSLTDLPDLF